MSQNAYVDSQFSKLVVR